MKHLKPWLLIAVTATICLTITYLAFNGKSDVDAAVAVEEPDSSMASVIMGMIPQVPVPPSLPSSTTSASTTINSVLAKTVEPPVPVVSTPKKIAMSYAPVTGSLKNILLKIARCESGNNPQARNQMSSAKGLLQIIDGTWESFHCEGDVLNAEDNMNCGIKIATLSGLHHWNESRACWGKQVDADLTLNTN